MNKAETLVIALLFFFATGCKKEKSGSGCEDFPPSPTIGYNYLYDSAQYETIMFSSNNYNEFVGTRWASNGQELFIGNIQDNSLSVIVSFNNFFGYPKWGRNDWILLNGNDWNIYKIKQNGDSLTQLTFTNNCLYPTWNYNADKIIYYNNSVNQTRIIDVASGEETTFTLIPSTNAVWNLYPEVVIGLGTTYVYRFNLITQTQTTQPYSYTLNVDIANYTAIDSNTFIFCYNTKGVQSFNWATNSSTILKNTCDAVMYSSAEYNKQNNRLYFSKTTQELINSSTIRVKQKIVSMNLDGSNEQELVFPE